MQEYLPHDERRLETMANRIAVQFHCCPCAEESASRQHSRLILGHILESVDIEMRKSSTAITGLRLLHKTES